MQHHIGIAPVHDRAGGSGRYSEHAVRANGKLGLAGDAHAQLSGGGGKGAYARAGLVDCKLVRAACRDRRRVEGHAGREPYGSVEGMESGKGQGWIRQTGVSLAPTCEKGLGGYSLPPPASLVATICPSSTSQSSILNTSSGTSLAHSSTRRRLGGRVVRLASP